MAENNILRTLTDDEVKQLRQTLIEIYTDIKIICDKYDICCMLNNGSCLGAILWDGFIPWDNDMDVIMTRKDYIKFIEVFKKEMSYKYDINSPLLEDEAYILWTKICKKNTLYLELTNITTPFPKGIFVDVASLEYAPKSKIARKLKDIIIYFLFETSVCMLYSNYPDPLHKKILKTNKKRYFRYLIEFCYGKLVSLFIKRKNLMKFMDKFISTTKKSDFLTDASSPGYYCKKTLPKSDFFPPKEATFENLKVNIMNNPEKFFKGVYGKIEKLPPKEKRISHPIVDIQFDIKDVDKRIEEICIEKLK